MYRHQSFFSVILFAVLSTFATHAFALSAQLRVMSYNINGLPWPIKNNKKPLFQEIAKIINAKKLNGSGPDVIFLQEGFRPEVKDLVAALNYPYVFKGPKDSDKNPLQRKGDHSKGGLYSITGHIIGSGLWILSKYPILKADKIAFDDWCTGIDCYANKGVAYAQIQMPGVGPVDLFTTHMNSRKASGSSEEKVEKAQARQLSVIKYFFDKISSPNVPAIFAGDFNIKTTYYNYPALAQAVPLYNAGLFCEAYQYYCKIEQGTVPADLHISHDQQFYRRSNSFNVNPIFAARTMSEKLGDKSLSDHLAYEVIYRFDSM